MGAIEKIVQKLRGHPELNWAIDGGSLNVDPVSPDGYRVWIDCSDGKFTVGFDGWHEHFDDEDEALDCFAFGFSDQCRLKVVRRGDFDCAWTLESQEHDTWIEDSTVGLFMVPFWRKKSVIYKRNALQSSKSSTAFAEDGLSV